MFYLLFYGPQPFDLRLRKKINASIVPMFYCSMDHSHVTWDLDKKNQFSILKCIYCSNALLFYGPQPCDLRLRKKSKKKMKFHISILKWIYCFIVLLFYGPQPCDLRLQNFCEFLFDFLHVYVHMYMSWISWSHDTIFFTDGNISW